MKGDANLIEDERLSDFQPLDPPQARSEFNGGEKFLDENRDLLSAPAVDAYYDANRKEFLMRNEGGRWLRHTVGGFKMLLRRLGHSTKIPEGSRVSPAEEIMATIMNQRDVQFTGPLAGRDAGFYDEDGVRFLVTNSPHIIAPARGDWPEIRQLLTGLVGSDPEHGQTQLDTILAWLKCAYMALKVRKRQPAQALALAGPVGCGKSLLQHIITKITGGRSAKPFRYLAGLTTFNSEIFGAEHLALEDESSSTEIRNRHKLAAEIKAIAVNETHSCHAKGQDAVLLRPSWWLTISLNNQPENLLVLPPITEDVADKLIMLKCASPTTPFPTGTPELKAAYWQRLVAEIPAFLDYLVEMEVPDRLRCRRYGVRHFHHPELLASLGALSPEAKLLELIDRELWSAEVVQPWQGTAGELEGRLRVDHSGVKNEAMALLRWGHACGTYLGRLATKYPDRVQEARTATARKWRIKPPKPDPMDDPMF